MSSTTTSTTRYLDHDGGRIAYDDTATDGPAVVCVPGFGDTRNAWRHLRPLLVDAGYRVVTVDPRGQGESSAKWDDYSTVAVASDILAVVRHLDAGPVLLVSNSYTGGPSFQVAAQAPDLFAALVMTGPFAREQPEPSALVKAAAWFVGHSVFGWTTYWSTLFKTTRPADFAEVKKALAATMREPGRMAALRAMMVSNQGAGEAAAANVRCPVLVVMGSVDPDFKDPAGEANLVAGLVSNSRVAMIEGAGHYPSTEYPQATADVVIPFLAKALNAS
jgi:pimeloyl-ACP methyl ester carboxylesterase